MTNTYLEPTLEPALETTVYAQEGGSPSPMQKALAWSAHLFTASGALWGLLTLLAVIDEQWVLAFVWMGVSIFVDSFDGYFARQVRVKTILPNFDGALLDNMVDYLNYVFVPAFFLSQTDLLPAPMRLVGAGLILLASSYQFSQNDAKTEDHYFKGFPSYWNILVYYLFILNLNSWVNLAVVALLAALVFVPIKYVYPSRTALLQRLTLSLGALWGIANVIVLMTYPAHAPWLVWGSLLFALYYTGLSLYATLRRHP